MEIHIDGELAEPFFDAIKEAPFSESFKVAFIDEVLTTTGLRFGRPGFIGFFDGSDMITLETGDLSVRARPSRAGELMMAALRALSTPTKDESSHLDTSPICGVSPSSAGSAAPAGTHLA